VKMVGWLVGWLVTANTSMEPMLSMLMANMAQVGRGSLVCDPFVGSGQ